MVVLQSIKLEPSSLNADPWEPSSNSSNHSYDDVNTTTTPPVPIATTCITSPQQQQHQQQQHPSPLHHNNHLPPHTPGSAASPSLPASPNPIQMSMNTASNGGDLGSPVGSGALTPSSDHQHQHLSIPGLSLHADDLSDATQQQLHDSARVSKMGVAVTAAMLRSNSCTTQRG